MKNLTILICLGLILSCTLVACNQTEEMNNEIEKQPAKIQSTRLKLKIPTNPQFSPPINKTIKLIILAIIINPLPNIIVFIYHKFIRTISKPNS